jgi:hypothetical protein
MSPVPLVSILLPAYNGERLLPQTLNSVRTQTYSQFELIVVDDGSTDGTAAVVEQAASADPRLRLLRQCNAHTQAARNAALREARGEWIALLDQDDIWLPDKLASQLALARADPRANLLFTNYWNWDGQRDLGMRYTKRRKFPEHDVSERLAFWCLFGASTVMIKRAAALALGGFDTSLPLSGDWDMWLRLAEGGLWARGVWEPQVRYRLWPGNASRDVIGTATEVVSVLEKALLRPQPPSLRRACRKSLGRARGNLELARLRPLLDGPAENAPDALWRAWQHCPSRLRLLFMFAGVCWPRWLGGMVLRNQVLRRIRLK